MRDWYRGCAPGFQPEKIGSSPMFRSIDMSGKKKEIRDKFRSSVFKRDRNKCRMCSFNELEKLDAHHITDRKLMPSGGYVPENGISLCPECHIRAEVFHSTGTSVLGYSPEDLYTVIGSSYNQAVEASKKLSL